MWVRLLSKSKIFIPNFSYNLCTKTFNLFWYGVNCVSHAHLPHSNPYRRFFSPDFLRFHRNLAKIPPSTPFFHTFFYYNFTSTELNVRPPGQALCDTFISQFHRNETSAWVSKCSLSITQTINKPITVISTRCNDHYTAVKRLHWCH